MSNQKNPLNMADLDSALPADSAGLGAEDRAGLVNSLKDKLQDLAADDSDFLKNLPANVRRRVDVLREIQVQYDELEAKFLEERAALEVKYQKLYEPLYTKRYEIVNGLLEVEGFSDEGSDNQKIVQSTGEKGVPNFWLTAMKTNDLLAEEILEHDEGALQHLKDIKWYRIDGSKGFKLEFFFDPNPYFKNSVLTKTYHMINEDEHILEKATGTEIEWFPGKILTQKIVRKKPKKGSKNLKPITKTEDCESFFNFFDPPQVPEDEDIDEETVEILQNQMQQDYEIGSTIRDKIIPHAVSWFTGEAVQDEEFEDTEDDEDGDEANDEDEDEGDEDENEEDEEDEDENEEGGRKKKGGIALEEVD